MEVSKKNNWLYKLVTGIILIFPLTIAIMSMFVYSKYNDINVMKLTFLFWGSMVAGIVFIKIRYRIRFVRILIWIEVCTFINGMIAYFLKDAGKDYVIVYAWLAIVILGLLVLMLLMEKGKKSSYIFAILTVLVIGFSLRILLVEIFHTIPVSDFARVYGYANPSTSAHFRDEYVRNAYVSSYYAWESLILKAILSVIGGTVTNAQLVNIFMALSNIVGLVAIGTIVFKNKKLQLIPAYLYAVYPSAIMNEMCLAHENYFNFLLNFFLIVLAIWYKNFEKEDRRHWGWLVALGVCLGVACQLKPIHLIIYIAFAMVLYFYLYDKRIELKKAALQFFTVMFVFIVCTSIIYNAGIKVIEIDTQQEINVLPYRSLGIGLNTYNEAEGKYDAEISDKLNNKYIEIQGDPDEYKEYVLNLIIDSWKQYPEKIVPMFITKIARAWGEEGIKYFANINRQETEEQAQVLRDKYFIGFSACTAVFAVALYVCCIVATVRLLKKKNSFMLFQILLVTGFAFLLLLTEAQSRYKAILFLPLCIYATYGIESLVNLAKEKEGEEESSILKIRCIQVIVLIGIVIGVIFVNLKDYYMYTFVLKPENIECVVESDGTYTYINHFADYNAEYLWEAFDENENRILRTKNSSDNTWNTGDIKNIHYIKAWVIVENGRRTNVKVHIGD